MIDHIDELQEALEGILPSGFSFTKTKRGELIIYTTLTECEDGSLMDLEEAERGWQEEEEDDDLEEDELENFSSDDD